MPPTADATALYEEGRLGDAIAALDGALRDDPADTRSRTFLFELLCFAGDFSRAAKQLDAISASGPDATISTAWYKEALRAAEQRRDMFRSGEFPDEGDDLPGPGGTLNGEAFERIRDVDPRIGTRLEVLVGGRYTWIPFRHLERVAIEPPQRLRDLYWIPAEIEGTLEVGAQSSTVLLPVMTPSAADHSDELVRLGRVNDWQELDDRQEAPVGRKLLAVDEEEISLLEIRELEFHHPES